MLAMNMGDVQSSETKYRPRPRSIVTQFGRFIGGKRSAVEGGGDSPAWNHEQSRRFEFESDGRGCQRAGKYQPIAGRFADGADGACSGWKPMESDQGEPAVWISQAALATLDPTEV